MQGLRWSGALAPCSVATGNRAVAGTRARDLQRAQRWLWLAALLLVALWMALVPVRAQALKESDFLPPGEAFALTTRMAEPTVLELAWRIAPTYYMYRDQFRIEADPATVVLGEPEIPRGTVLYDQVFEKDLETHRDAIVVRVPLPADAGPFAVLATSQGCADAGLCYPPDQVRVALSPAPGGGYTVDAPPATGWSGWLEATDLGLADALAASGLFTTMAVFFGLGILLSLTPCVLPMVPILSSLVLGDAKASGTQPRRGRGLLLAAAYVLGMSVVYTAVGVAAGLSGAGLAAMLQTPWLLGLFAALLAVLALAMFDVFSFQVPSAWQSSLSARAGRLPGGRVTGALAMGAVSALIVGPCVAAPLAGALLYISQTGDVWLGGAALFALAWGMGVVLLVAGASASAFLPRAGAWMKDVQHFFGLLMLATAWWTLLPVLPTWVQMLGWAVLALIGASLMRAFDAVPPEAGAGARVRKALGWLLALMGVLQMVGLVSGGRDPLQPLAHLAQGPAPVMMAPAAGSAPGLSGGSASQRLGLVPGAAPAAGAALPPGAQVVKQGAFGAFVKVSSLGELESLISQSGGRPVLLDFYADWCVACKEMERFTFTDPVVAQRMSQMLLIQADVTANTPDDRALLKRFRLFGPPGIMFFDGSGRELTQARVVGFQNAERFGAVLGRVLAGG